MDIKESLKILIKIYTNFKVEVKKYKSRVINIPIDKINSYI